MKQGKKIVQHLQNNPEGLTTFEATLKLRITKLSTRIGELDPETQRHISRTWETGRNEDGEMIRYIRYRWVA